MIKINDADGKTRETAIVIDADDDREARIFYIKFLDYYMDYHKYANYDFDDVGEYVVPQIRVHYFYKDGVKVDELWMDISVFFYKCAK